jgi:hypothetical protein
MYPSIKTRGTHLSCILLYKHEELIYHLSSHNKKNLIYHLSFHKNTRYPFIIYPSIKIRGTHLSFIVPFKFEELIYNLFFYKTNERDYVTDHKLREDNKITTSNRGRSVSARPGGIVNIPLTNKLYHIN